MSYSRRSLSLLILITLIPSSVSVICDACEGVNCKKGGCSGDYCVKSYYSPRFGSNSLLKEATVVKGCMNGTMLADNIKSQCYYDESDELKLCICNGKKCTSSKKEPVRVETTKITCKCKGTKGCDKKNECTGDLCVWSKSGKDIVMGCMDLSVPLIERRAIDSCMMPPMTGSMHFHALGPSFGKELLNTESCICSTKNCNAKKPFVLSEEQEKTMETQTCNRTIKGTIKGKNYKTDDGKCTGEFCYKIGIYGKGIGQLTSYYVEGCATFNPESTVQLDDEFSSGDCVDYTGNNLKMKTCFTTKDKDAKERLEESVAEREQEEEEGEEEEGEEEEEEVTLEIKETIKLKDERSKGKKEEEEEEEKVEEEENTMEKEEKESGNNDKKEEEETRKESVDEKNTGEGDKNSKNTKHFVFVPPTVAPTPDESNATMITVFVLIILCICVAGITWKFQLHRKLMRANYDTVAGG